MRVDVAGLLDALGISNQLRGSERWGRCPFHEEKDGSWQIRDEIDDDCNGLWRCFGCGAKGNATMLVESFLGVDRVTAVDWMERQGLIAGERALPVEVELRSFAGSLRDEFRIPAEVIFGEPSTWVTPARRYVASRGITREQCARWGIGYALDGLLHGRIVFPIRERGSKPVGYTARTFVDDPKRYLEPKRGEYAVEGCIFGEEHWPETHDAIVVTEGAINALAVERALEMFGADFECSISIGAVRGSNFLSAHAMRLSRFRRVLVASDPDAAGDKLWEAIRCALGRWVRVDRVVIPAGSDAAEMPIGALGDTVVRTWHETRTS